MKKEVIIKVLNNYVNTQLDTLNSPLLNICKPIVKRIINNNIYKVDNFLDLLKDNNNNIDIINIIDEMVDNLFSCNPFDYDIFHFENEKINIKLLGQRITITKQDVDLFKDMLSNETID